MRNQEIFERLTRAKITESFSHHMPEHGLIRAAPLLRERLETLSGIPGFSEYEKTMRESLIYRSSSLNVSIPKEEWGGLTTALVAYQHRLLGVLDYVKSQIAKQTPDAICVKLPTGSSFRDTIIDQDRLEKALSQLVLLPIINGKIDVEEWETGSLWLRLSVGSIVAVTAIGMAAWSAAVVYKKIQEGNIAAEYSRSLGLKNEVMVIYVNAQQALISNLVDSEARALINKFTDGQVNPEDIERVKHTIKELAAMIEKGAEIHPALQAPEEVTNLFPNLNNLLTLESRTKMLQTINAQ